MSMKTKDKGIKKFSKEEKLAILEEGKKNGIKKLWPNILFFRQRINISVRNSTYMAMKV